jgi:hypothetical protein
MAIGAQDIGEHVGIARVTFASGGAVTRTAGFDDIGMDRDHRVAGGEQSIDDQAGWPLNSDRQLGRRREPPESGCHVAQAARIVAHVKAGYDATYPVDDTDGMACTTPVQASVKWPVLISSGCGRLARAGRSRGSLTDRRSGRQALALHPVVRRYLPAPAVRRGLSRAVEWQARNGRHGRCSGWQILRHCNDVVPANPKVHQ